MRKLPTIIAASPCSNSDCVMSSVQGLFELGDSFMVRAHAAFPFLVAVGSAKNPVRIEAGFGWHFTTYDVESEPVTLSKDYTGDYVKTKYINVPVLNRNSRGRPHRRPQRLRRRPAPRPLMPRPSGC